MSNALESAVSPTTGLALKSASGLVAPAQADATHETAPNRFVEANGYRYAYRRFGKAGEAPLVFLQRFRGTMDDWDPAITNGLAATREVILFDNAGVGLSSGKTPDSVGAMAAHLAAFVEALKLAKVDLLGFSLGGLVAQQAASDRSDLIGRVILAGAGPKGGEGMQSFTPEVTAAATRQVGSADDILFLFFQPSETSQAAGRAFLARTQSRKLDRDTASTEQTMQAQAKAIGAWGGAPNDGYAGLRDIKQPVLVVNGSHDIMIPTVNSFLLAQYLPNAQLILYPDAGHGSQFQYPELFVEDATRFLS